MFKKLKFIAVAMLLVTALTTHAQVTTASMTGVVSDASEALVGATIEAVHTPSGTKYHAVSNLDGRYNIQGMRTGGPYTLKVTYVGYEAKEYEGIYLELGNTFVQNVRLDANAQSLDEVVVTAKGKAPEAGASRNFSLARIEAAPTIDRGIYDVVKNMPMVNVSKLGGISFAGSNNRYNSFQIDGTMNNDVFGLAASGTNGGQASANPISLDAIQEIQVVVAPFDVRQSGFTGGGINAITKQGTNDFHATYFTYYNNENFYGRYDASRDNIKAKLSKQHTTTIGGNISGPIVKDKLFFFFNVENTNESYPSSYYAGYADNYLSQATAQQIADKYRNITGIQEGFGPRDVKHNALDLLGRIDWNINENNKLALRYQHADAYDDKYSSGYSTYYFNNSTYRFNNVTNSFVAELNSNIGKSLYNELRASYNRIRDTRDVPYQGPLFWIRNIFTADNSRRIAANIGTEYSSGANLLNQDVYTIEDNLSLYKGNHTITFGTHNEFYRMKNLFIQAVNGEWVYNSLDDFMNDNPTQFVFKCSNPELTGGNLRWTPVIKSGQLGFYVQDKYAYSNNLELTYGIRVDLPMMFNDPDENAAFNTYSAQKGWGVKVGEMPDTKVMVSPRFGFRIYADDAHNTLFRGGAGLFTGRVPFVWLSNAYSNTGVKMTGTTINNPADIPAVTNNPNDLISYLHTGSAPVPDIVTVDKDFRYPQVLRANLAWEQKLPYQWKFTAEGLWSKTLNNAYFENLALTQNGYVYAGPGFGAAPYYSVDRSYNSVINLRNTNRGYTYSLSAAIEKSFDFGLNFGVSYTYGHSKSVYDGTSSVAYSNWRYNYAVDSKNPALSYSMFDQPHRVNAHVTYTSPRYANGWLQSEITLTYNTFVGQRYSLTMSENADYNGDGYRGNSLMYIPTSSQLQQMQFSDITSRQNGETVVLQTAAQQRAAFEEFLAHNSYTKNHRGQYAERNSQLAPWEHHVDLHFAESIFYLKERGSKVMLTFDVLNFGNMLNKHWGKVYNGGVYNVTPLTVTGIKNNVAQYQWNGYTKPTPESVGSRWHAQVGVKVIF